MQYNKNREISLGVVGRLTGRLGEENLAILLVSLANLLFLLYVSQHGFSPFQTNFARGVCIFFTHIAIGSYLGIGLSFKNAHDFKYLLIRNSLFLIQQFVYAAMHYVLSFPLINSINISGPLFVFLLDYYLNGVTINRVQAVGIAVAFAGILLNINGDFLMSLLDPAFEITTTYQNYQVTDTKLKILFAFLALLSSLLWGYAIVLQKKIRHVSGLQISFFLGVEFIFTSCVSSNLGLVPPITLSDFLGGCVCSGLVMTFCQLLFTSALNLSKNTGKLGILNLLTAVTAYAISYFKFDEKINVICLTGLLVMSYGLYRTIFGADR
jgi:drug/metabolite transporter (DMT)-like permease